MTASRVFHTDAPGVEVDLDATPEPAPVRRWPRAVAAVAALLLTGGGAGVAAHALLAPQPAPELPRAQVALLDAHLENVPIATLRLTVHNTGPTVVSLSRLVTEGLKRTTVITPLAASVPAGTTVAVAVRTAPDCGRSMDARPLRARLELGDGRTVHALPARALISAGGLCRQVRGALPGGWHDPLPGGSIRPAGPDLEVRLPAVAQGSRVAGIWAGETLLTTRQPIGEAGGTVAPFRLVLPDHCAGSPDTSGIPTGVRLLLIGEGGLQERYAPLGAGFARWLVSRCGTALAAPVTP